MDRFRIPVRLRRLLSKVEVIEELGWSFYCHFFQIVMTFGKWKATPRMERILLIQQDCIHLWCTVSLNLGTRGQGSSKEWTHRSASKGTGMCLQCITTIRFTVFSCPSEMTLRKYPFWEWSQSERSPLFECQKLTIKLLTATSERIIRPQASLFWSLKWFFLSPPKFSSFQTGATTEQRPLPVITTALVKPTPCTKQIAAQNINRPIAPWQQRC